ncbi:hypothetical protein L1887_18438 [Cichorium endivia]|nr:hypothetical protein L1887_18438 [Cichorium endivia]
MPKISLLDLPKQLDQLDQPKAPAKPKSAGVPKCKLRSEVNRLAEVKPAIRSAIEHGNASTYGSLLGSMRNAIRSARTDMGGGGGGGGAVNSLLSMLLTAKVSPEDYREVDSARYHL